MVRHSTRNIRGGDRIYDIQSRLDRIQEEVNELKNSSSMSLSEQPMMESSTMKEPVIEKSVMEESVSQPVTKSWYNDKNTKFRDGAGGRVSLSFPRIITLIDNNINKGNTNKDWTTIKRVLNDANSIPEVQDIINRYKISFSSNYVAGTRKRRRGHKRKTHRRH